MIPICDLNTTELYQARIACAYIFSPQYAKSDEFLKSLNFKRLKQAYREKIKRYHPDHNRHESAELTKRRSERFIKLHSSYDILRAYFSENVPTASEQTDYKRKIIAIGGAKGGIGKSLFAANLGVFLSNKGFKTVAVDLDLGGANLHLYLGETFINNNITEFLKNEVPSLHQIMRNTKYGPRLIGGDSTQLGAANISFLQKLKLLKAIRNIDADYIIIDLGGDTSYNIIDFFISADHGIVLTSCDPASYLDAYSFIKTSLYRKLNRLFAPESGNNYRKDQDLKGLIDKFTMSKIVPKIVRMEDFVEKVSRDLPGSISVLRRAISTFSPYLVVNKVPCNFDELSIVKRIQKVSVKMLSIKVKHIGSIPYDATIEQSATSLIPVVARSTNGNLSSKMGSIVESLLGD